MDLLYSLLLLQLIFFLLAFLLVYKSQSCHFDTGINCSLHTWVRVRPLATALFITVGHWTLLSYRSFNSQLHLLTLNSHWAHTQLTVQSNPTHCLYRGYNCRRRSSWVENIHDLSVCCEKITVSFSRIWDACAHWRHKTSWLLEGTVSPLVMSSQPAGHMHDSMIGVTCKRTNVFTCRSYWWKDCNKNFCNLVCLGSGLLMKRGSEIGLCIGWTSFPYTLNLFCFLYAFYEHFWNFL
jgi:hypothetical protein